VRRGALADTLAADTGRAGAAADRTSYSQGFAIRLLISFANAMENVLDGVAASCLLHQLLRATGSVFRESSHDCLESVGRRQFWILPYEPNIRM
jgi:hypothetical protein